MNTKITLLGLTSLALVGCGDNKSIPDAARRRDSAPADAYCSNCPAAPTIGTTQIDRMGRPAISTALVKSFNDETPTSTAGDAAKDAYNADKSVATWPTTYAPELATNLAILDLLDGGLDGNGICEIGKTMIANAADCPNTVTGSAPLGCGNQIAYSGAGTNNLMAYGALGGLLADDRLYVDTSRTTCGLYLAVEFGVVTGAGNTTCGGRAPAYDVIDFTYSVTALGIRGFSTDGMFTPQFGDGVVAHTDLLPSFPYLGTPH
jgi:hypothetical protein